MYIRGKPDISVREYVARREKVVTKAQKIVASGRPYKRTDRLMVVVTPSLGDRVRLLGLVRGVSASEVLNALILAGIEAAEQEVLDKVKVSK